MGRGQLRVGRDHLRGRKPDREDPGGPRERLPLLRFIITIDGDGEIADAILLDEIRARGRAVDEADLVERRDSVGPEDGYTFIYTSGTTGPPKGCVLLHRNYRSVLDMINERGLLGAEGDLVYLFLPLAHAFALLIQLGAVDTGTAVAYFGGDTRQIIPELMQVHPTYLPSVPRIFEKLFTLAQGQIPAPVIAAVSDLGGRSVTSSIQGQPVPQELLDRWNAPIEGDEQGRSLAQISRVREGPVRREPARGRHRRRADRLRRSCASSTAPACR